MTDLRNDVNKIDCRLGGRVVGVPRGAWAVGRVDTTVCVHVPHRKFGESYAEAQHFRCDREIKSLSPEMPNTRAEFTH